MKLQEGIDFIVVKKGGYYDGRLSCQQMGNLVLTKQSMILNVMLTTDTVNPQQHSVGNYKNTNSLNPVIELKNSVNNLTEATKDAKLGVEMMKETFHTMKEMGVSMGIIEGIAAETDSLDDFETRVAAMGEDNPKSLHVLLKDINRIKSGLFTPLKIVLKNGNVIKMFAVGNKKKVKNFLRKQLNSI